MIKNNHTNLKPVSISIFLCLFLLSALAFSNDHWDSVQVTTVPVAEGLYMLMGEGGNVGVSVGEDGTFIIDDQYAQMTDKPVTTAKPFGPPRRIVRSNAASTKNANPAKP